MKLLTFLGVGTYNETVYYMDSHGEYPSRFAPAASWYFLHPDEMFVFLTEDASSQIYPQFLNALPSGAKVSPIPVPLGKNENELWQIFSQVSNSVVPGEEVAFDVTHGLRSFPLVGLLVAAFLKSGFQVDVKAVLYGAYDVGRAATPGRTPIFDLTPMLSLLEWSVAADRFNQTGDSRYLAALVRKQRKQLASQAGGDPVLLEQVGHLANLAGALNGISQSLYLIRPYESMLSISGLSERVEKARLALQRSAPALPFTALLESIIKAYAPLANADPVNPEETFEVLRVELKMIHWYMERELWVQAISLAREWLVSWVMAHLGYRRITQFSARQNVEGVLGSESSEYVTAKKMGESFKPRFLANIPNIDTILSLWPNLSVIRNDIDHAAKREDPKTAEELIDNIGKMVEILDNLCLSGESK